MGLTCSISDILTSHSASHEALVPHSACEIASSLKGKNLCSWNLCYVNSLYCPSLILKPQRFVLGKADRFKHEVPMGFSWCNKVRKYVERMASMKGHFSWMICYCDHGRGWWKWVMELSVKVLQGLRTYVVKIMLHFLKRSLLNIYLLLKFLPVQAILGILISLGDF